MNAIEFLNLSKTQYHATENAQKMLLSAGFKRLFESEPFNVEKGGRYFIVKDGSALIAFTVGNFDLNNDGDLFKIVASHTDSPCFKVKTGKNLTTFAAGTASLNVERYGGGLLYTWFDRPLKLAGRLCGEKDGKIIFTLFESENRYVIPSVAIHFRRNANDGFAVNSQVDCPPLFALCDKNGAVNGVSGDELLLSELNNAFNGKLLDADLYLICDEAPFIAGKNGEFICSPRIDNLTSCFTSISALISASENGEHEKQNGVSVAYLADNEEVGSRTKQGAASTFLRDVLKRVYLSLFAKSGLTAAETESGFMQALAKSFIVSCDNAHANHPNHPEYADKTCLVKMGGGIVIKHHGNLNYTTDGLSSALFKSILNAENVPYCDFYMRSDLPCGGTLGAISSSQISIKSVDIGLAQLAMHSAVETMAAVDVENMINGLKAFYKNYKFFGET
ncbi:MAG: M18 family aminopeptidase [Candidatus Borkfalkiaceae bacterium]|nr:M18 family aminopeptidase [Christensenellaceae bacterium]